MMELNSELLSRLVSGRDRDGRCRYDPQAKKELVGECLRPGVSVASMALRYGVNANLLRKWITKSLGRSAIDLPPTEAMRVLEMANPFVPVRIEPDASPTAVTAPSGSSRAQRGGRPLPSPMRLQVRLPNGVAVDLGEASLDELSPVLQMLHALPCSN